MPRKSQFIKNAVVMPVIKFAPERLRKQVLPALSKAFSIIRAVVVLPFVPVTIIILSGSESFFKISFLKNSANLPGSVVAPLPKRRSSFSHNFAIRIIINILNYID